MQIFWQASVLQKVLVNPIYLTEIEMEVEFLLIYGKICLDKN